MRNPVKVAIFGVIALFGLCAAGAVDSVWEDFTADGAVFSCRLPSAWGKDITGQDRAKFGYGVTLHAPGTPKGHAVTIQADYFPKDNITHKTPQRFFHAHLESMPLMEGESNSAITTIEAAGKKCWYFEEVRQSYFPPETINPVRITFVKKFVVVPETDNSFFVLRLEAPADVVNYYRPVFDMVVKSFRPQVLAQRDKPSHVVK